MARERGSVRFHRGGWELRVQIDGQKITRRHRGPDTRAGRREAEAALDRLVTSLTVDADRLTVADLLDLYAQSERHLWAPSTREKAPGQIKAVKAVLGDRQVDELRRQDIKDAWAAAREAHGWAPATARRYNAMLSAALSWAVDERGIIATNPAARLKLTRRGTVTPVRVDHLPPLPAAMERARTTPDLRLRTAALVALGTGVRRGELAGLRWIDIDLEAATVRVAEAISADERSTTKAGPGRTITIDATTVAVLRAWRPEAQRKALALGHRLRPLDPVWCADDDPTVPWPPDLITAAWARARPRIGCDGVRLQDLRHIHATALLRAGVPVHVVSHRLGHASPKMTIDVYAHILPGDDAVAVAVIAAAQHL